MTSKLTSNPTQIPYQTHLTINNLVFVDNTVWITNSHQAMQQILNTASQFYNMCDIEINSKKTEVIYYKPTEIPPTTELYIRTTSNQIQILPPNICTKYLGLYINANGTFNTQLNKIRSDITLISNLLNRKCIIDKQAIYIINQVLIPAFEYRSQLFIVSKTECNKLMRQLKKVVKSKARLSLSFPDSVLHHPKFFALDHLWSTQTCAKITELFYRLNDPLILGLATHIRLQYLQEQRWLHYSIISHPTPEPSPQGKNLIASILPLMYEHNISFTNSNTNNHLLTNNHTR